MFDSSRAIVFSDDEGLDSDNMPGFWGLWSRPRRTGGEEGRKELSAWSTGPQIAVEEEMEGGPA